jgi:hypothetical protein
MLLGALLAIAGQLMIAVAVIAMGVRLATEDNTDPAHSPIQ